MKLQIEVTAEDIAAGKPSDTTTCPIAIATQRALKARDEESYCFVGVTSLLIMHSAIFYNLPLSPQAVEFVQSFDFGEPVTPFNFEIEVKE